MPSAPPTYDAEPGGGSARATARATALDANGAGGVASAGSMQRQASAPARAVAVSDDLDADAAPTGGDDGPSALPYEDAATVLGKGASSVWSVRAGCCNDLVALMQSDGRRHEVGAVADKVSAFLLSNEDPVLRRLAEKLRRTADPGERLAVAREGFRELDDLWTCPEDRRWHAVNDLVARLLDLSQLVEDRRDPTSRDPGSPIGNAGGDDDDGRKPASGTPEETDLNHFLNQMPLFGPEDLRVVR